ncbi:hypothetical protein CLOM621_05866 [Clostridium sp. M62/1]|nr:hypothetical protein CLOM621_05866 [Clostridium sp. M62/1]
MRISGSRSGSLCLLESSDSNYQYTRQFRILQPKSDGFTEL